MRFPQPQPQIEPLTIEELEELGRRSFRLAGTSRRQRIMAGARVFLMVGGRFGPPGAEAWRTLMSRIERGTTTAGDAEALRLTLAHYEAVLAALASALDGPGEASIYVGPPAPLGPWLVPGRASEADIAIND